MNVQRISALPFPFQISFTLPTDRYTGRAVTIQTCAQPVFQADFCEGLPTINATYNWLCNTERFGPSPTFTYTLTSPASGRHIQIVFLSHVIRLYVDNQLQDEEWPLGSPTAGIWEIIYPTDVSDVTAQPLDAIQQPMPAPPVQALHGLVPDGHNTGIGDCMPFVDNNTLHLYYLFDRRSHQSKNALGAHQWAHMSTTDLCNWKNHPIAVGITEQWEGSICTGSVIRHKDTYYAFYAVRMSDGSPAKMTWATSQDGIHFEKSGQYFSLSSPYEPVSARDPMVFADDNGVYHMLVTTSLVDVENGGCLAHLTSHDLLNWEQHAPFYVPGFADQPECSDYFRWNGWYYLVFSNYGTARYRMSRNPVGPWLRPEDDTLDSLEIRVPKVARLHNKRYSIGFLNRRNGTYAGSAIIHELYQRDNGSLGVKFLPSAFPAHETFAVPTPTHLEANQFPRSCLLAESTNNFRLQLNVSNWQPGTLWGLSLKFGVPQSNDQKTYTICVDPAASTVTFIRPNASNAYGTGREMIRCMKFTNTAISIDLFINDDILDVCFSDGHVLTLRLDHHVQYGISVSAFSFAGTIDLS